MLGDCDGLVLCDGETEGVSDDDGVCEKLWDGDCDPDIDCDGDVVRLPLCVCVRDWLEVALGEGDSDAVSLKLGVPVGLPDID